MQLLLHMTIGAAMSDYKANTDPKRRVGFNDSTSVGLWYAMGASCSSLALETSTAGDRHQSSTHSFGDRHAHDMIEH